MKIVGIVLADEQEKKEIAGIPVVCEYGDMMEYIRRNVVDEVFVHLSSQTNLPINKIIKELEVMGVTVDLNINVFEMEIPVQREIERIGNYYTVSFSPKIHSFKQIFFKRVMDIVGAIVGLLITGIVTVFLAPALLIESPGPLFFSQVRVGKNGRRFKIYKFRSMYMDAEERKKELMSQNEMEGLMFKMENDPRVTKVGKFIRKTSIDELPQFWNILKGEMSLVGTRPPTEDEFLQYEGYHRRRLNMTPGLTGLWQVSGRSDTKNFEEIVAMDVEYIDNWSLKEDIKILFKTVGVVLKGKGAS
ncbi:sugar transferase [[Ruminococcus] lactaris]|uniref:sugar transferase n=1 Tax=[Ruminococcus] lactaris TaxID=46228 RepID=UPI002432565B|nr:sugar transferase [[Ruminococcus] lactaris]